MDGAFGKLSRLMFALPAVATLAIAGQAFGDHGRGDHGRGWDRGWNDHHSSRGVRVGFGFNDCGSGVSVSFGSRGYCGPAYCPPVRSYCAPVRSYCGPVYCPPTVIVRRYDDYWPRPVVYAPPVVVERQVVVESAPTPAPVVVEKPVYVQQPVVTQAVYSAEVKAPVVATAPAAEPAASYRDRELGDAYMRMGDPENAARVYTKYLTAWNGDGTATRNLGFAQIGRGDSVEGAKAVVRGYQLEPQMVQRPLAKSDFGGEGSFQKTLDNATRGAAGSNSAESWLTVALLQKVAGQKEQAINALQKSRDAGLDKAMLDQFTLELSK